MIQRIANAVRRLHDTGRSGWFLLVGLIPFVGWIILIVWFATEGDPGPNEFGNPPGAVAMGAVGGAVPPPAPQQTATVAPGWHPDPSGRHDYRYWDGATWTENVADGGVVIVFAPDHIRVHARATDVLSNLVHEENVGVVKG